MDNSLNPSRYQSSNKDRFSFAKGENFKGSSPLRYMKKGQSIHNREEEDEEEEYERRREEELKKQIRSKEAEIQNLSKAQDYLRQKLDQSSTLTQRQQQPIEGKYASFGRQVPEREKSPYYQAQGAGGKFDNSNENYPPPAHIREHISNLQSDNASLMRRLNLVLQELDRVCKEKEEIQSRLQMSAKDSMNLQRMINGEDNMDKVNRYMQEDLGFEQERNQKLRNQIREQDLYKSELIKELREVEDGQDHQVHQNQNISSDLQKKLNQIQEMERELFFTHEKIKQLNQAIEQGKREEINESAEKSDLQRIVNQLLFERNDLISKLENLTSKYDECVREISQDRQEMEKHNKQHSKLVTAKIIFQELEFILKNKYKQGLEEMKVYCTFDSKCHDKLQRFAKVLDLLGKFQQKTALQKWFQSGLKPLEVKAQSNKLAANIYRVSLLAKKYNIWKKKYQRRIQQYDLKTKAIQHIWNFRIQDAQVELKRALAIWKGVLNKTHQQKARVKKLIWGKYFKLMNQALNTWVNHSCNIDNQIRLSVLSQKFTKKQYTNLLFNSFKFQSFELKRKRLNIMFHTLKYWKDYINYKKFLMGAQVSAMHFSNQITHNLVKSCFDAFKQNKEEEKFAKMDYELNQIERPMIADLNNDITTTSEERLLKIKNLAGECLCRMMNKNIYQYFGKWKQIYLDFKEAPNHKMKGRIIKAYYDKIRLTFNKWKVLLSTQKVMNNEMMVEEQQDLQKELTDNVLQLQKEIRDKQDQKDQSGQRGVNKCVKSYEKRMLGIALGRWRDKIGEINVKEDGADTVVKRLRCRILRQAFDLYVSGIKYKKKVQIEEERCRYFNKTRNERMLSVVFNQWRIYKKNFLIAKKYWYRIYQKMDKSCQKKGFKTWKEFTKLRAENSLQSFENNVIGEVVDLNHEIGEINAVEEAQQQQIKKMKQSLTRQAQRVLANAFANYYYVGETRGFEKWKEYTKYLKHRETLMKRAVEHWRKHKFYYTKSCFKNWMLNADIKERKDQVKKEEVKIKDTENSFEIQQKQFAEAQKRLNSELEEINQLQQKFNSKLSKSIGMIVSKVDTNYYMSQKRYILKQWRSYVKREKFFIKCIQNVIQKSLWNFGFQSIREHSRFDKKEENKEQVLNRFRLKFWKRTCGNAFSVWRRGIFNAAFTNIQETIEETNEAVAQHQQTLAKRKGVNENKAVKTINKHSLRNLFNGWKNVAKFLKSNKQATKEFNTNVSLFQKRWAVQKWRERKNATHLAKLRGQRLREKFARIRKMHVFRELKHKFYSSKDFMSRISNLANIHDHQALKMGYNTIISFARAKKYVHQKQKEVASRDVLSVLNSIVQRRKSKYLSELQHRTLDKYKQEVKKGFSVFHFMINKLKAYFNRWKGATEKDLLALEMHYEGPVREQIFEDRIDFSNCKNFLKQEGYDDKEINEALKKGKAKQFQLMLKTVRRLQHYNPQLYTKPKMFDRWKQFVHLRKLFRYWLHYVGNRSQYIKCDVTVAFERWKKFDKLSKESLKRLSKNELDKRVLKNAAILGELADDIQDKEINLRHLNDQREELVENYIKGQKLALSLWLHNLKRSKHQAFMRWSNNAKAMKGEESGDALRKNVDLIAALKERIRQLEKENDDYSGENEELRQFSLDGYEIAKNVQTLSQEREKLSVDLADKAQTIKKLLDENEKLNKKLKMAQDEAQSLIKSTNKYMGGSSSSGFGGPYQSPMMRNNVF